MQTSRAVLNDRAKEKPSTFHKICTYEHSTPYFQSDRLHGYEFSHMKSFTEQLVFHKQEVRPTPISLPTPPASPEFYGTSLQKWYHKKPLFTLTAKGQVKRLEKYLQIQKTLEICKREYQFQIHRENMKKEYVDFEFREQQPLLYENMDVCFTCSSSRNRDADPIPIDYRAYSPSQTDSCMCSDEYENEESEEQNPFTCRNSYFLDVPVEIRSSRNSCEADPFSSEGVYSSGSSNNEKKVVSSEVTKEGTCDLDDCGIFKIVVKNKDSPKTPETKHVFKLFSNKNFKVNKSSAECTKFKELQIPDSKNLNARRMAMITLDNVASFPFDNVEGKCKNCCLKKKNECSTEKYLCSSTSAKCSENDKCTMYEQKYDVNKNEVYS